MNDICATHILAHDLPAIVDVLGAGFDRAGEINLAAELACLIPHLAAEAVGRERMDQRQLPVCASVPLSTPRVAFLASIYSWQFSCSNLHWVPRDWHVMYGISH